LPILWKLLTILMDIYI